MKPGARPARKLLRRARRSCLPSLVGVMLFLLLPVVVVLLLSFVKWNFLQPPTWAGLHQLRHDDPGLTTSSTRC